MWVRSLGQEDLLDEKTATHSSILTWKISRTEEPGGLQSMGLQSQTRLKRLSSQVCTCMHASANVIHSFLLLGISLSFNILSIWGLS